MMEYTSENVPPKKFKGMWFKAAFILQILTAAVHSMSFLVSPQPTDETEKQMLQLMTTYKMDMGAGFVPTMFDLFNSLSTGFALLFLFGGLMNWYLWRKKIDLAVLKGVVGISVIIFGIMFVVGAMLSFLLPITMSGLVFVCLLMAWLTWPKQVA
jgi:FtsH-binding integral membrane protein